MARLTVPPPGITLYETGFDGTCLLGRKPEGQKLSDLVEKITEPMVIALDAPWGAGKSVFLKCWVGAHGAEFDHTATTTVYFDAFANDFIDDPLVSLVAALAERIEGQAGRSALQDGIARAKRYAPALGRGLLRGAINVATAGAMRELEGALDDVAEATGAELGAATSAFWKTEETRRQAMRGFRDSLEQIAAEDHKLIIVVDELDRCRPDYALALLEVIKHFFDVPNVHFILGVNMAELQNSVRARYGDRVAADRYLQKFITVTMTLANERDREGRQKRELKHFNYVAQQIGLEEWKRDWLEDYLGYLAQGRRLGLRDVERIATRAALSPGFRSSTFREPIPHFWAGLVILSVLDPEAIRRVRHQELGARQLLSVFEFSATNQTNDELWLEASAYWCLACEVPTPNNAPYLDSPTHDQAFLAKDPKALLRQIVTECLDVFDLPADP